MDFPSTMQLPQHTSISSGCFSLCWTNLFTSSTESNDFLCGHIGTSCHFIQKVFPYQKGLYTPNRFLSSLSFQRLTGASSYCGQGLLSHKAAHHHGIRRIIQLPEKRSKQYGKYLISRTCFCPLDFILRSHLLRLPQLWIWPDRQFPGYPKE